MIAQEDQATHELVEFSLEESKIVAEKITAVLTEHSGQILVLPVIKMNGTLGAKLDILKKVELVPKAEEGVVSPISAEFIKSDGENPTQPESGAEPVKG